MHAPTRDDLLFALRATLEDDPAVEAAWVAGSLAFGRDDQRSDIDLVAVVPADRAPGLFSRIEAALEAVAPIDARFEIPHPPTADLSQRFYHLAGFPESLMVDLVLMKPERLAPWLDPERHGQPHVLFDRGGRVVPTRDTSLGPVFAARLETFRARVVMFGHIPEKNVARGNLVEAVDSYHRMLLTPLVELLRARYSPQRQDFGFRYLHIDLPSEVYARLCGLMDTRDLEVLGASVASARAWLAEEMGRI